MPRPARSMSISRVGARCSTCRWTGGWPAGSAAPCSATCRTSPTARPPAMPSSPLPPAARAPSAPSAPRAPPTPRPRGSPAPRRPIARGWHGKLGRAAPWPEALDEWLERCHAAGQVKSTPILLKYGENGWNALHRDLYGDLVFPLQVVINLSHQGVDHTGGEFLLLEQRPRAQSRGTATLIPQGRGLVFTTRDRPVRSQRGWSAAPVRHGVSVIRTGQRFTLGLVFHDAA